MFNLHTAKQYHIYYLMRGEFKLIFFAKWYTQHKRANIVPTDTLSLSYILVNLSPQNKAKLI